MSFERAAHLAETGGLALLALCFSAAVVYALWPSNQGKFERAARTPLNDGEDDG